MFKKKSHDQSNNTDDCLRLHRFSVEYAREALNEAYRWESSIRQGASFQIAIFSFLITGITALEIGLYENEFKYFNLSLVFSIIVVIAMLIAILLSIISQWRMVRAGFPDSRKVIQKLNDDNGNQLEDGYNQLIQDLQASAESINSNNVKRTKIVHWANIAAVASITAMTLSILIMCVIIILGI